MTQNWQVFAQVLGAVATVVGAYVVARITARVSQHATDTTAQLAEDANAVQGFHVLAGDLRADIERLQTDLTQLRAAHEKLQRHVTILEHERAKNRRTIRALLGHIKRLSDALMASGQGVPDLPRDLDLEDGYPL